MRHLIRAVREGDNCAGGEPVGTLSFELCSRRCVGNATGRWPDLPDGGSVETLSFWKWASRESLRRALGDACVVVISGPPIRSILFLCRTISRKSPSSALAMQHNVSQKLGFGLFARATLGCGAVLLYRSSSMAVGELWLDFQEDGLISFAVFWRRRLLLLGSNWPAEPSNGSRLLGPSPLGVRPPLPRAGSSFPLFSSANAAA